MISPSAQSLQKAGFDELFLPFLFQYTWIHRKIKRSVYIASIDCFGTFAFLRLWAIGIHFKLCVIQTGSSAVLYLFAIRNTGSLYNNLCGIHQSEFASRNACEHCFFIINSFFFASERSFYTLIKWCPFSVSSFLFGLKKYIRIPFFLALFIWINKNT